MIKTIIQTEKNNDALEIRRQVFIEEQGVSENIERDSYDDDAVHVIAYDNDKPVATARLINKDGEYYIGRVATLKEKRGFGLGTIVMKALLEYAFENNINKITIHSQKHAERFYEKLGFIKYGDTYLEEGIEHVSMYIEKEV